MDERRSTLRLLDEITRAEAASQTPVFSGNTTDAFLDESGAPSRLPQLLAKRGALAGRSTVIHSLAAGMRQLTPPGCTPVPLHLPPADAPPAHALAHMADQLDTASVPLQLILDYAELSMPPSNGVTSLDFNRVIELLGELTVAPGRTVRGHTLSVIARSGELDERLTRLPGFVTVHVGLPDYGERLAFIHRLCEANPGQSLALADGMSPERLAILTGGLTLDDLLRGRGESVARGPIGHAWVQARKSDSLRRLAGESLIVYPPGAGLRDVAGLPQIRRLLKEVGASELAPRRLLLAGPPGVGKTLVVTAIADELGLPTVGLGNYRSMWVGESERRLRAVLSLIQSLAPCVLHIDEIDQSVGQRNRGQSADGGTSERILADLWTFLGDNSREEWVTVIATTNRPELLDPALFDRFTIIPVLHPAPQEAAEILRIAAARQGRTVSENDGLQAIDRYTGLLTGRVLVDVVERAMVIARLNATSVEISQAHLDAAFDDLLTALDPVEHELLALRAIQLCTFRSFLPWNAARWLGETPHLPSYLLPLLNDAGDVDAELLRARLRQLSRGDING